MDRDSLLQAEEKQLKKLQEIVRKSIDDESILLNNLLHPPKEILTKGQKISDKVARFGGS